jgi:hypothetical protein
MKRLLLPYLNNFVVWLIPKNIVIEFLNQKKIQKTIKSHVVKRGNSL